MPEYRRKKSNGVLSRQYEASENSLKILINDAFRMCSMVTKQLHELQKRGKNSDSVVKRACVKAWLMAFEYHTCECCNTTSTTHP